MNDKDYYVLYRLEDYEVYELQYLAELAKNKDNIVSDNSVIAFSTKLTLRISHHKLTKEMTFLTWKHHNGQREL